MGATEGNTWKRGNEGSWANGRNDFLALRASQ